MVFEPSPPNPFKEFISVYYDRCRAVCPKLIGMAGKWRYEDLVPGLSDFDTRFIVSRDTSAEDWAEMSLDVGRVHSELTRQRPEWARILEHLPGINLTIDELSSPLFYSAEFHQWTWYRGDVVALQDLTDHLEAWSSWDEAYHWARFAQFWGPYQAGIDPPINLGRFQPKYTMHSRYMHYFAPPVQAAVSLQLRRTVRGKLEALRLARELFPLREVVDETLHAVDRHYELRHAYTNRGLQAIQDRLHSYLNMAFQTLTNGERWAHLRQAGSSQELIQKLAGQDACDLREFFGRMRFYRLMRGRLQFYAENIPWFDTPWLIRNELSRLGEWACSRPLVAYVRHVLRRECDFEDALTALTECRISAAEATAIREVVSLSRPPFEPGRERQRARQVADRFEPVHLVLERLGAELRTSAKLPEKELPPSAKEAVCD